MDWRAASRSRSRLRAPVAPPTLSAPEVKTTSVQSRFYGDTLSYTSSTDPAHFDLATSLGLLPNADLFSTASGFDGSSLDFPTSRAMPPGSHGTRTPSFDSHSSSFAFPDVSSPPGSTTNTDANLAAIENTLNTLITLQSLAASSPHPPSPWVTSSPSTGASSPAKIPAPPPQVTTYPHPYVDGSPKVEDDGLYSFGSAHGYGANVGKSGDGAAPQATSAQLQLQHLANQVSLVLITGKLFC